MIFSNQAFISAWSKACSTPKSVLLVPQGRRYLVNATKFNGPCEQKLIIQVRFDVLSPDILFLLSSAAKQKLYNDLWYMSYTNSETFYRSTEQ